jgi:hypothetical protein
MPVVVFWTQSNQLQQNSAHAGADGLDKVRKEEATHGYLGGHGHQATPSTNMTRASTELCGLRDMNSLF